MTKEFNDCPCYECIVRAACSETCSEIAEWYCNISHDRQISFGNSIFKKVGLSDKLIDFLMDKRSIFK